MPRVAEPLPRRLGISFSASAPCERYATPSRALSREIRDPALVKGRRPGQRHLVWRSQTQQMSRPLQILGFPENPVRIRIFSKEINERSRFNILMFIQRRERPSQRSSVFGPTLRPWQFLVGVIPARSILASFQPARYRRRSHPLADIAIDSRAIASRAAQLP